MLVTPELVKTGTCGRQQDHIPRLSNRIRFPQSTLQSLSVNHLSAFNLRLDLLRRGANRIHALHPLPKQLVKNQVVAALILAAKNQMDVRGK